MEVVRTPGDFIAALAALGRGTVSREDVQFHLSSEVVGGIVPLGLERHLQALLGSLPSTAAGLNLLAVDLGAAGAGARMFDGSWTSIAAEALESAERDVLEALTPILAEPGIGIDLWARGIIHSRFAAGVAQQVTNPGPWFDAYRAWVASRLRQVWLTQRPAELCIDVVDQSGAVFGSAVLYSVPLQHLGKDGCVTLRRHELGLEWSAGEETRLLPLEDQAIEWCDPLLGSLTLRIHAAVPSPKTDCWDDVCTARRLLAGEGGARTARVARALAARLSNDALTGALERVAAAFGNGSEVSDEEAKWVSNALELRVNLEGVAEQLDDAKLISMLAAADERLQAHADAVLALDDEAYEEATADADLDPETWWGRRAAVDSFQPPWRMEEDLEALPCEQLPPGPQPHLLGQLFAAPLDPGQAAPVRAPAELAERLRLLTREELASCPCPWLSASLKSAYSAARPLLSAEVERLFEPAVGRAPVLLLDAATRRACVGEVRLESRKGVEPALDPTLLAVARDAWNEAFRAVTVLLRGASAPESPDDITVRVLADAPFETIDGSSLGLSLALALASRWCKRPLSADLIASAKVRFRTGVPVLGQVGGMRAKVHAIAERAAPDAVRVLVADGDAGLVMGENVSAVPGLSTLEAALTAAGFTIRDVEPPGDGGYLGDQEARMHAVETLMRAVRNQDLSGTREIDRDSPWRELAYRMTLLLDSLEKEHAAEKLRKEAWPYVALALTHAGDAGAAEGVLSGNPLGEDATLQLHAINLGLRLGTQIDRDDWAEGGKTADELERIIVDLPKSCLERGWAQGALGRWWMHRRDARDLQRSLVHTELAMEQFSVPDLIHERGRSRVSLSMALRMAGRYGDAEEALELAREDFENHTRRRSTTYYDSCRVFWAYERARLLVACGAQNAVDAAEVAERLCDGHGPWPLAGVFRTKAWALRAAGRHEEADAVASKLDSLAQKAPSLFEAPCMKRILAECHTEPGQDEVY